MKRKGLIFILLLFFNFFFIYGINYSNRIMFNNNFMIYLNSKEEPENDPNSNEKENKEVIDTSYNGESIEQIGKKIDRLLVKTPLDGYGEEIARKSIIKAVNPYLIGGIILESTKCKMECSVLLIQCNNVSGIKASPGCFGGTYKQYNNFSDSITDLVNNISKEFYTTDLQNPYKMFKKYGRNETWAFKVNKYMEELKRGK